MRDPNFKHKFCELVEEIAENFKELGEVGVFGTTSKGVAVEIGEPNWENMIERARIMISFNKKLKQKFIQAARRIASSSWVLYEYKDFITMAYAPYSEEEFNEWTHKIESSLDIEPGAVPLAQSYFYLNTLKSKFEENWKEKFAQLLEYLPYWLMYKGFQYSNSYSLIFVGSENSYYSFNRKLEQWLDGMRFAQEIVN